MVPFFILGQRNMNQITITMYTKHAIRLLLVVLLLVVAPRTLEMFVILSLTKKEADAFSLLACHVTITKLIYPLICRNTLVRLLASFNSHTHTHTHNSLAAFSNKRIGAVIALYLISYIF